MTSLKTSIKTITYLSDTGCLEIQGASLHSKMNPFIWVLIILMTLDALRELAGASSILGWLLTLV
ncbi:KPN_01571 family protein [Escherichia coli]